jgi:hypothetical protein
MAFSNGEATMDGADAQLSAQGDRRGQNPF